MLVLKGGLHDSFTRVNQNTVSRLHVNAVAGKQASSFNCIVNEPISRELIARG